MATLALESAKLQVKYKAGTLASGKDSVKSVTLPGASVNASAAVVKGGSDPLGTVIAYPVAGTYRVDTYMVE